MPSVSTDRSRWPEWALAAIAVTVPLAAFFYIAYRPETIIAFEKVGSLFLAWPYVTVVLALAFLVMFRTPLSTAIGRVQRLKGLGGEVELQVQPPASSEVNLDTSRTVRAEEIEAHVTAQMTVEETPIDQLPEQVLEILRFLGEPIPQIRTARDAFEFAGRMLATALFSKEDAQRWKFYYLSYFLIPNSKLALRWFKDRHFANRDTFENDWHATIPDAVARAIILSVLVGHTLLEETGGYFSVTREGDSFLAFLDQNNAWHQPAYASAARQAFYVPIVQTAEDGQG